MLLVNCGIRDIEAILKVSRKYILNQLINNAKNIEIIPKKEHYKSVQIDERVYYYVSLRKKRNTLKKL